jgi:hypothetical protein
VALLGHRAGEVRGKCRYQAIQRLGSLNGLVQGLAGRYSAPDFETGIIDGTGLVGAPPEAGDTVPRGRLKRPEHAPIVVGQVGERDAHCPVFANGAGQVMAVRRSVCFRFRRVYAASTRVISL